MIVPTDLSFFICLLLIYLLIYLQSDTCCLSVPELDIEVGPAALGGRFSTVEGILAAMKEQLLGSDVVFSDSADKENVKKLEEFHKKFNDILDGHQAVTLILDDPAGNSYVQVYAYSNAKFLDITSMCEKISCVHLFFRA